MSALNLYRRLCKEINTYPSRPGRPGRNWREQLFVQNRLQFEHNRTESNPLVIKNLMNRGEQQLLALKELKSNVHSKQYPLTKEILFPPIVYKADRYLSTDYQNSTMTKQRKQQKKEQEELKLKQDAK
eukprot:TRINITY_DN3417_c0_g1_i1.p1 TRINITY_DN3417_c0_g1~~TRINITY_DN3417_c0_g1_i1.p1  ORF type:complete len:128 (-),score=37.58 TRINITY_DN3417_c0_g1_i1:220-603(-)